MPKHRDRNLFGLGVGAASFGAVAGVAAGGWKLAEFIQKARKLHDVSSDALVFTRLTQRVRLDLAETQRLLSLDEVKWALSRSPKKVSWIQGVIKGVRVSLEEMGEGTENVDEERGKGKRHLGLRTRLRWVLDEKEKLRVRVLELGTVHQALAAVLAFLSGLEPLACCEEDEDQGREEEGRYYAQEEKRGYQAGFEDPLRKVYEEQQRAWYGGGQEPVEGKIRIHEETRRYEVEPGEEAPHRESETIRVREERYEDEEPERATIRVHKEERSHHGREEEPRREFVRSHHEKEYHGRDEPRETIRVREKTSYGREEDDERIRMADNERDTEYAKTEYSSSSSSDGGSRHHKKYAFVRPHVSSRL
ncbi:hypothetical protein EJ08DRAFT_647073 [Tothia fuscella]|uniref:Uncharacterized protein n=1 Tax=Tothia fuscella TaxID=1048955 RepID=A0A9P4U1F9_9PEZI|nr:hypothetical protein EJ08DRAFT_647073 [Tothia fuscella]